MPRSTLALRGFSPSRSAGNDLIAQRSSAGALTFYTASETLAPPGMRSQEAAAFNQLNINYQLATINYQYFTLLCLIGCSFCW